MKKLLSIAVCASAVAAFADPTVIKVGSVGVTAIQSDLTNTIVAVSYKELGAGDSNITISNIVKTANLTVGDLLHVFKDGATYETYTLTAGSGNVLYWDKTANYVLDGYGNLSAGQSTDASIATLTPGLGLWLIRKGWDGAAPFTFYIYGKPVTSAVSTSLAAGDAALIGNPTQSALVPTITGAQEGDLIQIPDSANVAIRMTKYKYMKDKTDNNVLKWTTKINGSYVRSLPAIGAGKGFSYVAGSTEGTRVISWPVNN
ncbi:MAG: hypothetical protein IKF72_04165 [Kiritimatiellae bacterium]|nr:hypothetical protein [Kiritimatiellia bacterium]